MLCKICQNIFPTLIKDCGANEPVEHHLTPETFLQSVREKCRICAVLWQNLSEEEKTRYTNSKVFEGECCTSYYAGNPQISAGLNSTRDPRMSFPSFTLDFDIDDRTPSLAYFTVEPVEGIVEHRLFFPSSKLTITRVWPTSAINTVARLYRVRRTTLSSQEMAILVPE